MSSSLAHPAPAPAPALPLAPRRLAVVRALVALAWAAGLVLAVGDAAPTTASDVPVAAAALLATYPLIDVAASLAAGARAAAAVSAAGALAVAATAFGADAGATLVAFGAWAAVSGLLQLAGALGARRSLPLLVSGGLSILAGLGFAAMARGDDAHLAQLAGYMALGAALFVLWAWRAAR